MHFVDFTGEYVYHCHILAHEDNGMMGTVKIGGPGDSGARREGSLRSAARR
jgi:suppressor of ftsI